jgi:hypothetical protein
VARIRVATTTARETDARPDAFAARLSGPRRGEGRGGGIAAGA